MAISLSSAFQRWFVGTAIGSMTELSDYIDNATPHIASDSTEVTSFTLGGAMVVENIIQGALDGGVELSLLYAATTADYTAIYAGKRDGFIIMGYNGSNAVPTAGDEVFMMSAILPGPTLTYNPGATSKITWSLMIADSATYLPDIYTL